MSVQYSNLCAYYKLYLLLQWCGTGIYCHVRGPRRRKCDILACDASPTNASKFFIGKYNYISI